MIERVGEIGQHQSTSPFPFWAYFWDLEWGGKEICWVQIGWERKVDGNDELAAFWRERRRTSIIENQWEECWENGDGGKQIGA
jgi:hypothetical protein